VTTLPATSRRVTVLDAAAELAGSISAVVLILPTALLLWIFSLSAVDVGTLDDYGLTTALPVTWYVALAGLVGGTILVLRAQQPRGVLLALYAGALVAMLYATVPLVSEAPQYSWVYKHIGVTRYLELHGQTNPQLDIYNRWPGFFALAALASRAAGMPNPVTYAAWAEPFFAGLSAVLVAAAARAVVASTRVAGTAAVVFLLANWVGQSYFAPQALGFVLGLAIIVVILRYRRPLGGPVARLLVRAAERVGGAQQPDAGSGHSRLPVPAIAAVLGLDAVLVPTHQLTPYILLLSVMALIALGVVRPRWIVGVMAIFTAGYLALNLGYVQEHFQLLTSLDPFRNVEHSTGYGDNPLPGIAFAGMAGRGLTFAMWLGAICAVAWLARRGLMARALPVVVLAVAPFALAFGQSYGGEISFRVTLFSLPWSSILIAWGLSTIPHRRVRLALTGATLAALAALFVPAFLGLATINLIGEGEVKASDALDAHAPAHAVLMPAAPNFPTRYGPGYDRFIGSVDTRPNILQVRSFRNRPLGPRDVPAVIAQILHYGPTGFLIFSTSQENYARMFQLTPPGALHNLERAVARSPRFRLWYGNPDARIYELVRGRVHHAGSVLPDVATPNLTRVAPGRDGLPPTWLIVVVLGLGLCLGFARLRLPRTTRWTSGPVR
jgi:hypothetical protein